MATRARKVPELPGTNSVESTDLFVVEKVSGNTSVTSKITGTHLRKAMVRGPYINDSTAASYGVQIGEMYYTAEGNVKVRLV